jgi:dipeptidyl aminopeptidase/acylaminoacyl peptidase
VEDSYTPESALNGSVTVRADWLAVALIATALGTHGSRCAAGGVIGGSIAGGEESSGMVQEDRRPVTVADAISMRRVAGFDDGPWYAVSPDRSNVAFVVTRGDLATNSNIFSLLLWRKGSWQHGVPTVRTLLTFTSTSIRSAIQRPSWSADGHSVFFLGEHPKQQQQLFSVDVDTRRVRQCTHYATAIRAFGIAAHTNTFAFVAEQKIRTMEDARALEDGIEIGTGPEFALPRLLALQKGGSQANSESSVFVGTCGRLIRAIRTPAVLAWWATPYLSPDGRYAIIEELVLARPTQWDGYPYHNVDRRINLIDLSSGMSRVLVDSPIGLGGSEVAWADDSRSVLISNLFLPLSSHISKEELERRSSVPFPVEVMIPDGQLVKLDQNGTNYRLKEWDQRENVVVLERRFGADSPGTVVYSRARDGKWKKLSNQLARQQMDEIEQIEDPNTPPRLFVTDSGTHQRALLLDLNPQFEHLQFSRVERLSWDTTGGYKINAGLYLPLGYISGKRYPLVIQTHGFDPGRFYIDGPLSSAFAAQPLAARGIMVIQLDNDFQHDMGQFKEVERETSKFRSVIAYLDERKLIDPRRVGIVGFSRTCLYVKSALTQAPFAAASVEDGWDGGYWQFLEYGNVSDDFTTILRLGSYDGQPPFGNGLKVWALRSPIFNIDKVSTPLRIVAPGTASLLGEWEWFAALRIMRKPVDMLLMQEDDHPLVRPWNRRISLQGNVDWFDFWLQGHEDSDPAKAEQYRGWEVLCDMQVEQHPNQPTFCVRSRTH